MTDARRSLVVPCPLGSVTIISDGDDLVRLTWRQNEAPQDEARQPLARTTAPTPLLAAAAEQLAAYFAGDLKDFDLPLRPHVSAHDRRVLTAMAAIPYGETRTYGALADVAESNARALGGACGRNPLPILIPCHRVVGTGWMGGFSAAGGRNDKRWLLDHEARHSAPARAT